MRVKKLETLNEVLTEYLKSNELKEKLLPLCHTTNQLIFRNKICVENQLKPIKECDYHNNEWLIFFFYGKSPYQPKEHQILGAINNLPITLIFNFDTISKYTIERLICFDSGGYIDNKYIYKDANPDMEVFTIHKPQKEHIIGLVQALFGTNIHYLDNDINVQFNSKMFPLSPCLNSFEDLKKRIEYNVDGIAEFGEQALTFELQVKDKQIVLEPEAIVIPSSMAKLHESKKSLKNMFPNSKIILYRKKPFSQENYTFMKEAVYNYSLKSNK